MSNGWLPYRSRTLFRDPFVVTPFAEKLSGKAENSSLQNFRVEVLETEAMIIIGNARVDRLRAEMLAVWKTSRAKERFLAAFFRVHALVKHRNQLRAELFGVVKARK